MRSRVMQFLCCLSLMLFVTCSEVFSIRVSAADFSAYNGYNIYFSTYDLANSTVGRIFRSTDSHSFYSATTQYINGVHHFQNTAVEGANAVGIETSYRATGSANGEFFFPVNNDVYNYYIVGVMNSYYSPTFKPDWLQINLGKPDGTFVYSQYSVASGKLDLITNAVTTSQVGYSFSAKVDFTEYTGIRGIYLISQSSTISTSSIGDNVNFMASIVEIPKSASQEQVNSIIAAIQKSTSDITGAIADSTDKIIDKVDDVLTPEGNHNFGNVVDNITGQIDDNMGALGFAHDTIVQFTDLFTESPGAPVISVPPMSMSIKGQSYQFFPGYSFDFRSMLNGPLAVLVTAVRTAGSISLWLAFLSYCNSEFNKFFKR